MRVLLTFTVEMWDVIAVVNMLQGLANHAQTKVHGTAAIGIGLYTNLLLIRLSSNNITHDVWRGGEWGMCSTNIFTA